MGKLLDRLALLPYDVTEFRLNMFDKKIERRLGKVGIDWKNTDTSLFFRVWVRDHQHIYENAAPEQFSDSEYISKWKEYKRLKAKYYPNGIHDPFDESKAVTLSDSEMPDESKLYAELYKYTSASDDALSEEHSNAPDEEDTDVDDETDAEETDEIEDEKDVQEQIAILKKQLELLEKKVKSK